MLTLEQIEEGRRMISDHTVSVKDCGAWLIANAEALFSAAEAMARGDASSIRNNGGVAARLSDHEVSDALDVLWAAISGKVLPAGAAGASRSALERAIVELWYRRGWKGPGK